MGFTFEIGNYLLDLLQEWIYIRLSVLLEYSWRF